MNLFLRLMWLTWTAKRRSVCHIMDTCRTCFRVLPTDLDVLRHVNNGRYFSILDLARTDLMLRSGLVAKARKQGWFSVVASETILFRRALKLFDRFSVDTRVLGWDSKAFLVLQRFVCGKSVVAVALVRIRFLKISGGPVAPSEVAELAGVPTESPPIPEWAETWNRDQHKFSRAWNDV